MTTLKRLLTVSTALGGTTAMLAAAPALAQTQTQTDSGVTEVEEIVVTGSYIRRGTDVSQASPIATISADDIGRIGAADIADITQTLTINTGSQNNPDAFTQNFSTGTSNINLRGLGVASTLILLNGRRQVVSGATTDDGVNFVDTASLVPMIAVQRMEILKDGAATLYGSDAVAGVVNFLTRDNFEGFELQAEFQGVADTGSQTDFKVEGIGGIQTDKGYAIAAISFLDRTPLTTEEKRLSPFGGPDVSSFGQPGTVLPVAPIPLDRTLGSVFPFLSGDPVADATPLAALQQGLTDAGQIPVFADPNCAAGENSLPPAGIDALGVPPGVVGFCRLDFGRFFNLVPEETRVQGYAKAGYNITDELEFFAEFGFARNRAERGNSPDFPNLTPSVLDGSNPFNPFGVPVVWLGRVLGQGEPANSTHDSDTFRFVAGLNWDINETWRFNASVTSAHNDFEVSASDAIGDRLFFALNGLGGRDCDPTTGTPGVGPCMFFNPFGSALTAGEGDTVINPATGLPVPVANSDAVIDDILGRNRLDLESDLLVVDAVLSGDLGDTLSLPGGPIGLAAGFQFRNEEFGLEADDISNRGGFLFVDGGSFSSTATFPGFTGPLPSFGIGDFDSSRDIFAVFGEVRLPFTDWFEVSSSVRYEDIEGIADTVDPKVGVLLTPVDTLTLRGTYSTSFRAPSIFQTQTEGIVALAQLRDPLIGNTAFLAEFTTGNQNLKPETSRQFNAGFTWRPDAMPGLTIEADYFNFEFEDVIVKENAQAILNDAGAVLAETGNPAALLDPQRFVRPLGVSAPLLAQVNTQFVNAPSIETAGIDFNISYAIESDFGRFNPFFQGTWIVNYDVFDPSLGIEINGRGNRNFNNIGDPTPPLRFNAGFNWAMGPHSLFAVARFIDSFDDDQISPTLPADPQTGIVPENGIVDSQLTLDLQYSLTLEDFMGLDAASLSVGAVNVTGEDPPFVNTNGGFASRVHDPRGRVLYVRLKTQF